MWWYSASIPADSSICNFTKNFFKHMDLELVANSFGGCNSTVKKENSNRRYHNISLSWNLSRGIGYCLHLQPRASSSPRWQECAHVEDQLKHSVGEKLGKIWTYMIYNIITYCPRSQTTMFFKIMIGLSIKDVKFKIKCYWQPRVLKLRVWRSSRQQIATIAEETNAYVWRQVKKEDSNVVIWSCSSSKSTSIYTFIQRLKQPLVP